MLTFGMVILPLLIVAMAGVGIAIGRKRRAQILQEHALHDQQRFLRMGFLRKRARKDEQHSRRMILLRKEAK
jgi:hypothetical protein